MKPERDIEWKSSSRAYSPLQGRFGLRTPSRETFPPATRRVTQDPDPYSTEFLDEREVLRVTYQGDDRCQLKCPGCYTADRLLPNARAHRRQVSFSDFDDHIAALGPGLQEFFLLGAEPTVDPKMSREMMLAASRRGLSVTSITHGAVSFSRFDETFADALVEGNLYKITISIDSMLPSINNRLRGNSSAHRLTLATIERCVELGIPIKAQMTVWPLNYSSIESSVAELFSLGVRAFAFHCGSVEGVTNHFAVGLDHLDPLAWRALCERFFRFQDEHADELWHFNFPLVFFTEQELRELVIGDDKLTDRYLDHVSEIERGDDAPVPVHACPALDVPQVYVWANDGPEERGAVSLCQIHSGGSTSSPHYARFDPATRRFRVVQDPAANQMQAMLDSPTLCPASRGATDHHSDRWPTEIGDLFHACRYLGNNQVPVSRAMIPGHIYEDAAAYYDILTALEGRYPPGASVPYRERAALVAERHTGFRERTRYLLADAADFATPEDALADARAIRRHELPAWLSELVSSGVAPADVSGAEIVATNA
jgi:sulfatase maturation enzyme AslB (radical SAM superfamily)